MISNSNATTTGNIVRIHTFTLQLEFQHPLKISSSLETHFGLGKSSAIANYSMVCTKEKWKLKHHIILIWQLVLKFSFFISHFFHLFGYFYNKCFICSKYKINYLLYNKCFI